MEENFENPCNRLLWFIEKSVPTNGDQKSKSVLERTFDLPENDPQIYKCFYEVCINIDEIDSIIRNNDNLEERYYKIWKKSEANLSKNLLSLNFFSPYLPTYNILLAEKDNITMLAGLINPHCPNMKISLLEEVKNELEAVAEKLNGSSIIDIDRKFIEEFNILIRAITNSIEFYKTSGSYNIISSLNNFLFQATIINKKVDKEKTLQEGKLSFLYRFSNKIYSFLKEYHDVKEGSIEIAHDISDVQEFLAGPAPTN